MQHIFIIISNICSIVVRRTIEDLVSNNQDVLIVTDRSAKWLYETKGLKLIDITCIYKDLRIYSASNISEIVKKIRYRRYMKRYVDSNIITDFFQIYIPNMALDYISAFVSNSKCVGYFIFEEGLLAYRSLDELHKNYRLTMKERIKKSLGLSHYFPLEVLPKFKGTICINENAFPWDKKKIINRLPDYEGQIELKEVYKNIVILSYIDDVRKTIQELSALLCFFELEGIKEYSLKFHPHSSLYEKEKMTQIIEFINKNPTKVNILPSRFVVEYYIFYYHSNIFSIGEVSSLSFYSVLFNKESYVFRLKNDLIEKKRFVLPKEILSEL